MSFGRGQMLQSVRQEVERDRKGHVFHFPMPDYTNETIEKFCRELAEKGSEAHLKDAVDPSFGSSSESSEVKTDDPQFYDVDYGVSSITGSMTSNAEGSESSCSLKSGVNELESSSVKSFTHNSGNSNRSSSHSPKHYQKKKPVNRLAVRWPEPPNSPEPKQQMSTSMQLDGVTDYRNCNSGGLASRIHNDKLSGSHSRHSPSVPSSKKHKKSGNELPTPMGRGRSLQMVSETAASLEKINPQREIMRACDPSYSNERIERYLDKVIQNNEMAYRL